MGVQRSTSILSGDKADATHQIHHARNGASASLPQLHSNLIPLSHTATLGSALPARSRQPGSTGFEEDLHQPQMPHMRSSHQPGCLHQWILTRWLKRTTQKQTSSGELICLVLGLAIIHVAKMHRFKQSANKSSHRSGLSWFIHSSNCFGCQPASSSVSTCRRYRANTSQRVSVCVYEQKPWWHWLNLSRRQP